jgi:hypothetical protein
VSGGNPLTDARQECRNATFGRTGDYGFIPARACGPAGSGGVGQLALA